MDRTAKPDEADQQAWAVGAPVPPWIPYGPIAESTGGRMPLLSGPQALTLTAVPLDHPEIQKVTIDVALIRGRYAVGRFEVQARGDDGVSAEAIRRIPTATLVRKGLAGLMRIDQWHWDDDPDPTADRPGIWQEMFHGPLAVDQGPVSTALVYLLARAVGEHPTKAVAQHFGISPSAAANRVRRARVDGLLPATTKGRTS